MTILGYDMNGEPIRPAPRGSIVTQAFILCSMCRGAISATGGPRYGSVCLNCHPIRKAFEDEVYPSFGGMSHGLRRKPSGEYLSDTLEDHWQTFQEGWELAIKHLQNKSNPCYTDVISDGGMDPRV